MRRRITKAEKRTLFKDLLMMIGTSFAVFSIYNWMTNSINGLWLTILGVIIIIFTLWWFK